MDPAQVTVLTPLAMAFIVAMSALFVALPRRFALLPMILTTCYLTFGQQVMVAGLHFRLLRVLVLVGCARIIVRHEMKTFRWQRLDTLVTLWAVAGIITYTLLWQTSEALVNRLGFAYDAFGLYFIFRCFVRDLEDVQRICRMFAIALVPLVLAMCMEKLSGRNPFFVFGGVPEFTEVREGVLRCQGPFGHPILAGTFGAVWLPLFAGLWLRKDRSFSVLGVVSSTLITLLAGSSGPVGAYAAGIVGFALWPLRKSMRQLRWAIVGVLAFMQVVMKAPIWFVFARVSFFSGSTGWHRANLIDQTISHLSDWWLVGAKETYSWGVWGGDITNQFILEGIHGGLATMILFIAIVVSAFAHMGRTFRLAQGEPRRTRLFLWAIGVTVFSHCISFMNVSYFDQNVVNWYLALAAVAAVSAMQWEHKESENPVFDTDDAAYGWSRESSELDVQASADSGIVLAREYHL